MNSIVGVNSFVERQNEDSGKTYSKNMSFREIAEYASSKIIKKKYEQGYRDGVIIVPVEKKLLNNFVSPIVKINDKTKLNAEYVSRRPEEEPYIKVTALNGKRLKTGKVELILYRNDVLKETNENETNKKWELISFHAVPIEVMKLPMGPVTMMRNQLQLKGGTKGYYSSTEWAKSVEFWQKYCFRK